MASESKIMSTKTIKIVLVDDHTIMRKGLHSLIQQRDGLAVIGEAANGHEALDLIRSLSPDIAVMDVLLQEEDGIELSKRILAEHPKVRIIVLSSESDLKRVTEALQAGVSGYVVKTSSAEELMRAIAIVMDHRIYLCPEIASQVVNDYMNVLGMTTVAAAKPVLTERERSLLKLVAAGKRNKEIAEALGVAVKSVETYRSRLMKKLGCFSASELTRYAIREGIAPL
jgi:DNA-binding NarL/FixJ family response regulator